MRCRANKVWGENSESEIGKLVAVRNSGSKEKEASSSKHSSWHDRELMAHSRNNWHYEAEARVHFSSAIHFTPSRDDLSFDFFPRPQNFENRDDVREKYYCRVQSSRIFPDFIVPSSPRKYSGEMETVDKHSNMSLTRQLNPSTLLRFRSSSGRSVFFFSHVLCEMWKICGRERSY